MNNKLSFEEKLKILDNISNNSIDYLCEILNNCKDKNIKDTHSKIISNKRYLKKNMENLIATAEKAAEIFSDEISKNIEETKAFREELKTIGVHFFHEL